ncbi:uncharacterized protein DSM5745_07579 [Aspergillus mulundensis]|uniref:EthD domain-containing protein n=1 Tax=Aspergillus mulundensis TaxID=1810919 RepID=A0A3D8REB6_9EURO|nr:hypothetical protein DSM5745_07579 [Aspergillus mulundensis]RDW72407.1 hypothetical protein DSM5745_07579 [Aspergillus mulundensis]
MVVTVLIIIYRKPTLSPTSFRHLYEAHVNLVHHLTGDAFPLAHRRTYVAQTTPTAAAPTWPEPRPSGVPASPSPPPPPSSSTWHPMTVANDAPAVFGFDVVSEVTFADDLAYERFVTRIQDPAVKGRLCASAGVFADGAGLAAAVVGDVVETRGAPMSMPVPFGF